MIYGVVLEGDESVIKIGYSGTSIIERMDNMQTSNWRLFHCLAVMPGEVSDERRLHHEFKHYRVNREWFLNFGDVAEWVRQWAVTPSSKMAYTKSEIRNRKAARLARADAARAQHIQEVSHVLDVQPMMRVEFPKPERVVAKHARTRKCAWPGRCDCADCKRRRIEAVRPFEWRGRMRG